MFAQCLQGAGKISGRMSLEEFIKMVTFADFDGKDRCRKKKATHGSLLLLCLVSFFLHQSFSRYFAKR